MIRPTAPAVAEFRLRALEDPKYCRALYDYATVRLLAHKYAYYVLSGHFVEDVGYDGEERSWFVMGRALDLLSEDETSPCIGFDETHPKAAEGRDLALSLKLK